MDCHIYSWDVRPFVLDDTLRCEREYMNVHHGAEKNLLRCAWSIDQEYVTCGSADRYVYSMCVYIKYTCENIPYTMHLFLCVFSCIHSCVHSIVKIWNASSGKLLYYLPGHKGSVNQVRAYVRLPVRMYVFICQDVYSLCMYISTYALYISLTYTHTCLYMHVSYGVHLTYICIGYMFCLSILLPCTYQHMT